METTPRQITKTIRQFCNQIVPGGTPKYVPVRPAYSARQRHCHPNVIEQVRTAGGRQHYGWAIWEKPGYTLTAEFHSVWESPVGEWVDITPHADGELSILFLPDPQRLWDGRTVPNRVQPLTNNPLVRASLEWFEAAGIAILLPNPSGGSETPTSPAGSGQSETFHFPDEWDSQRPRATPKERAERRRERKKRK